MYDEDTMEPTTSVPPNISYNTGLLPPGLLGISEKGSGQLASW